ncbi:MAG: GNAT family N-acetyltransferase [Sedimentisphaerales bacterium]|nr:GNAT family N-acetyltransferase [Sedimentisphaerales bacterium]
MKIRKAKKADKEVLIALIRDSFRDVAAKFSLTAKSCPKFPAFNAKERIEGDFEKGLKFYILEENGRACGCVALEKAGPVLCYLGRLAVLPEYRNRGFGKALVSHLFEQAKAMDIRRVEIGIISKHRKLKNWYKKLGFIEKGTRKFDHLPFIVAFMYKELNRERE